MLDAPGERQPCRRVLTETEEQRREGCQAADAQQQRGELQHKTTGVALRMRGQQFTVNETKEEIAIKDAELPGPIHGYVPAMISAILRESALVSCSTARCVKMPSSVGWASSILSCAIESSAT